MSSDTTKSAYPKLISWEVWNFMSIAQGKCEFDDKNIINIKGYNDSGKSAMLTALKVLCTNFRPNKQVDFIQDDKDYFRILATFEGGIQILRDKYINGQSLYEMYKDGTCIFSTKSESGALTKVADVPKPIEDFLGLVNYDDTYLNFRSCFEEQLGVQTKGSENYKMFNTVLKSEEISTASELLNNDRNKLASDINSVDSEIIANKNILGVGKFLTESMISYLEEHDSELDSIEGKLAQLAQVRGTYTDLSGIIVTPELSNISYSDLVLLSEIKSICDSLDSFSVAPEVSIIDSSKLDLLNEINSSLKALDDIKIVPEIKSLEDSQLNVLSSLLTTIEEINQCNEDCDRIDGLLKSISEEVAGLEAQLIDMGVKMVRCPNCGVSFSPDEEHNH